MDTKEDYQKHISILKFTFFTLASALSLLTAYALYLTWSDRNAILDEANEIKNESIAILKRNEMDFNAELARLERLAEQYVDESARISVGKAFSDRKINKMIEDKINEEYGYYINKKINKSIATSLNNFQEELILLNDVAYASVTARFGQRRGLDKLLNYSKTSSSNTVRQTASEIVDKISAEQEKFFEDVSVEDRTRASTKYLISQINNSDDLGEITILTINLRKKTGHHFKLFDFEEIEKWCKANPDSCK